MRCISDHLDASIFEESLQCHSRVSDFKKVSQFPFATEPVRGPKNNSLFYALSMCQLLEGKAEVVSFFGGDFWQVSAQKRTIFVDKQDHCTTDLTFGNVNLGTLKSPVQTGLNRDT